MSRSTKIKVYTAAILFAVISGIAFLAIKKCTLYGDSLQLLVYRYSFGFIGLLIWTAWARAHHTYPKWEKGRPVGKLALTAAFYIAFMVLQIVSMYYATSIEGSIVYAITPIFAKIIGRIFLREKSTALQNVFVGITVAALMILIVMNATDIELSLPGILLMVAGCICMAASNVFMRYVRGTFRPIEITTTIVVGGTILFHACYFIRSLAQGTLRSYFEPLTHPVFVIGIAFLGICCMMLTTQFMSYMLVHLELVQSTIFGNVGMALSVIIGAVVLGEALHAYHILCLALILLGVFGLAFAPTKEENAGKRLGDEANG